MSTTTYDYITSNERSIKTHLNKPKYKEELIMTKFIKTNSIRKRLEERDIIILIDDTHVHYMDANTKTLLYKVAVDIEEVEDGGNE